MSKNKHYGISRQQEFVINNDKSELYKMRVGRAQFVFLQYELHSNLQVISV